ncbi:hypothetical protein PPYR_09844 [Photinus pyralis]|uniref:Uncharacterized protein n=1 Tax=Photinus pyralis TaxID=7054 RepID=A0A1Y1MJX9_PHOPY|nr:uncharacterized protein LOC116174187 [Photinus pyralis]KAB0795783.1 hypothetical protein PPYR_09844 [Photinus pyralis]
MNSKTVYLFVTVLVACCVQNGWSLKCYTCASPEDSTCGRDFNSSTVPALECDAPNNVCIKAKPKIEGVTVVTRLCGTKDACALLASCVTCDSDLCNTSASVKFQFWLLSLIGVVYFYL